MYLLDSGNLVFEHLITFILVSPRMFYEKQINDKNNSQTFRYIYCTRLLNNMIKSTINSINLLRWIMSQSKIK